jgi:hypothetical protein
MLTKDIRDRVVKYAELGDGMDEDSDEPDKSAQNNGNTGETPARDMNMISPIRKEDQLFWCVFIAGKTYAEFREIGDRYKNREMEEKQKLVEHMKANIKTCLASCNTKVSNICVKEMMSDLMTNKKTNTTTLIALCMFYKIAVLLLNESNPNTYLDINPDVNANCRYFVIVRSKDGFYSVDVDTRYSKIDNIRNTMIRMDSCIKPLRACSFYRTLEIEGFANKLGIEYTGNKADTYASIFERCSWKL